MYLLKTPTPTCFLQPGDSSLTSMFVMNFDHMISYQWQQENRSFEKILLKDYYLQINCFQQYCSPGICRFNNNSISHIWRGSFSKAEAVQRSPDQFDWERGDCLYVSFRLLEISHLHTWQWGWQVQQLFCSCALMGTFLLSCVWRCWIAADLSQYYS